MSDDKRMLLRNCAVTMSQLELVNGHILRGYHFDGCRFYGPAVLAFVRNIEVTRCTIGPLDAVLWVVAEGKTVVGVIAVEECTFTDCRFDGIGFAVVPDDVSLFEAAISTGCLVLDEARSIVDNMEMGDEPSYTPDKTP